MQWHENEERRSRASTGLPCRVRTGSTGLGADKGAGLGTGWDRVAGLG
jgi:hypothetical protein